MDFLFHRFERLESTNDEAVARARIGAPAGTVVIATTQTRGRGRQNRSWLSPSGNLFMSVLLRPAVEMPRYGQLAFVCALAVGEAIGSYGVDWRLKWPNDVLVEGAKISGLLLESEPGWVVAGIGVNVAQAPEVPGRLTTCLHQAGALQAGPTDLAERILSRLDFWQDKWEREDFSSVREAWKSRAFGIGQEIRVVLANGQELSGTFSAIDSDGALLLKQAGPSLQRILAGDVFFHE